MPPDAQTHPDEHRQLRFTPPTGSASLLLIRHGESAAYRPDEPFELIEGQSDPGLHPAGREQAERLAARLANQPIAAVYVSSLRRTAETAAPLAARLGLTPVVVPALREVFLGEWDGGLYRKFVREGHPIVRRLREEERWEVIPGAERSVDFERRVVGAVETIAARHPDQLVALVVHGGVIGALLAHASGSRPFAFGGADNGSISHLVVSGDRWVVRRYNDTAHLEAADGGGHLGAVD